MFPEIFKDDVFRLEAPRLWLRWPTARDEAAIERFAGNPRVSEMTATIPHPYPKGAAASFIYRARVGNAQGTALTFALAPLASPHELLGVIDLRPVNGIATLGYWLGPPYQGRGLMSEAVDTLARAAFALTSIPVIAASARVENPASQRVLEKCGFHQRGERAIPFPACGATMDCVIFERSRADERHCGYVPRRVSAR